jgi:ribonuclease HI
MEENEILMYFDGASKGNPGPSGGGFWVKDVSTSYGGYKFLGTQTNNAAEYSGLILGLESLSKYCDLPVKVHGDSKLVIEQMNGKWQVKAENLKPLNKKAKELSKEFKNIKFVHIDRSLNSKADSLANIAVNTQSYSTNAQI